MERFSCKTNIFSGRGAAAGIGALGIRRLLLVTEPAFEKSGVAARVASAARAEAVEIFSKVTQLPTVDQAADAIALTRQFLPDTVAALGSGAIDCAKAIVRFSGVRVRLVILPTVCTGAELTDAATLTGGQARRTFADPRMQPEVAILDSELTHDLPPSQIAETGFCVLSHALEAYVATDAGAITDALARDAFATVFAALPASLTGKVALRQRIHTAAAMAGIASSQAGLGLCHAMAQALGGIFYASCGHLNGILLPAVIDCNAHRALDKYAQIARGAGLVGSTAAAAVQNLKAALIRLRRELGMPATLTQAGMEPRAVRHRTADIVKATLEDPGCLTNPMPVEDFMVRRILEEAIGRVGAPTLNRLVR